MRKVTFNTPYFLHRTKALSFAERKFRSAAFLLLLAQKQSYKQDALSNA